MPLYDVLLVSRPKEWRFKGLGDCPPNPVSVFSIADSQSWGRAQRMAVGLNRILQTTNLWAVIRVNQIQQSHGQPSPNPLRRKSQL
jgi:hypothetical protein